MCMLLYYELSMNCLHDKHKIDTDRKPGYDHVHLILVFKTFKCLKGDLKYINKLGQYSTDIMLSFT